MDGAASDRKGAIEEWPCFRWLFAAAAEDAKRFTIQLLMIQRTANPTKPQPHGNPLWAGERLAGLPGIKFVMKADCQL
jgi:hypothetical protein